MHLTLESTQYHAASGMYLTLFRAYDPGTGRWVSRDPIGERGGINLYSYVAGNPVTRTDKIGLATDGKPLNSLNCDALKKIVEFEKENGKVATVLQYNPFNFSEDAVALDASFPSVGGPVSIDWMMRSAGGGMTSMPIGNMVSYLAQKSAWNMLNLNVPWMNVTGESNWNSFPALNSWIYGGMSLAEISVLCKRIRS
nr:RHS repeat-associated core domain-containing protein [Ralstonia pseudosolanacearum]